MSNSATKPPEQIKKYNIFFFFAFWSSCRSSGAIASLLILALHEHVPRPVASLSILSVHLHALGIALDLRAAGALTVLLGNSLGLSWLRRGRVLGEQHVADSVANDATSSNRGHRSEEAHTATTASHHRGRRGSSTLNVDISHLRLLRLLGSAAVLLLLRVLLLRVVARRCRMRRSGRRRRVMRGRRRTRCRWGSTRTSHCVR
mmetsp:Transcript_32580/g.37706  ORF Transcript_32580/g.37706 Transcript_32580/m.37706 type:complete len:203 (-) Transcript_32580:40-648(-)